MYLEYYGLDSCYCFSSLGLNCYVVLKMTDSELSLLIYGDMYQFFEIGVKRGISHITQRHIKANNKYIKYYDAMMKINDLKVSYRDENSLHECAMYHNLPVNKFE